MSGRRFEMFQFSCIFQHDRQDSIKVTPNRDHSKIVCRFFSEISLFFVCFPIEIRFKKK